MNSSYIRLLRKAVLPTVNTIFEVGSRDCLDAIKLADHFARPVHAFEANPEAAVSCRRNIVGRGDVIFVPKAVSMIDGEITFNPFDTSKYDNIGASSMFEIDFTTYRDPGDADYGRLAVQKKITVPSVRLDTYCATHNLSPDLLCLDVQGAELIVLSSLGQHIDNAEAVITECASISTYKGGCSFWELHDFLTGKGLRYLYSDKFGYSAPPRELGTTWFEFDTIFARQGRVAPLPYLKDKISRRFGR